MNTIAVIINNKARNATESVSYLHEFDKANIPYIHYATEPANLTNVLQQCIKQHSLILVGGGDGTIRTAAQYCAHQPIILGVLPLGTLNHFAKEMALPNHVEDLITSIKNPKVTKIDLAEVNNHIFINNSSLGFYPKFTKKRNYYSKSYNKWLSYIPGFIESFKKHPTFNLIIKSGSFQRSLHTSFLMISNNIYTYTFPTTIKRENFHSALLGLYYFKQGKLELFKIIQRIFGSKRLFEINQLDAPIEIHCANQGEITISLDGETQKLKTPLYYRSLPNALNVLTGSS